MLKSLFYLNGANAMDMTLDDFKTMFDHQFKLVKKGKKDVSDYSTKMQNLLMFFATLD